MQARIGAGPTSFSHLGRGPLFRSAFSKFHVFLARILRPRFSSLSSACRDSAAAATLARESRDCQRLLRNLHHPYFRGVSDPERCREYRHAPFMPKANKISANPLAHRSRCLPEERNASHRPRSLRQFPDRRRNASLTNSHGY